MLSEREGCEVLLRVFKQRGYSIEENVPFTDGAIAFNADGWDAASLVGYEYLTHEAGDYDELTPAVVSALEAAAAEGRFHFLLVDETSELTVEALEDVANAFLDQVETRHLSHEMP